MNNSETHLMLVDDHKIFLDGLKLLLELQVGMQVSYLAQRGEEALARLKLGDIQVVITDINMPEMDGVSFIQRAKPLYPEVKFLALTMLTDQTTVRSALEAGADAYLLKNSSGRELRDAIRLVLEGRTYISAEINAMISRSSRSAINRPTLTSRETEVLAWIVKGRSSKEIAREMYLSIDTIKYHRKNILSKLEQPNSAALVKYAVEEGLVH